MKHSQFISVSIFNKRIYDFDHIDHYLFFVTEMRAIVQLDLFSLKHEFDALIDNTRDIANTRYFTDAFDEVEDALCHDTINVSIHIRYT